MVMALCGFNLLSQHLKCEGINIHGADFDQRETDFEPKISFSFLGTLLADALASFSLSEDVPVGPGHHLLWH